MTTTHDTDPAQHTPLQVTLLDLVSALVDSGGSEREVVAAVLDLLETGRVRLIGQICEPDLQPLLA